MMQTLHSPFKAIADPTRREILSLLVNANKPLPITSITENFNATRQAVTKHIKILSASGLIDIRKRGRERYCNINPAPLREVYYWLDNYKSFWNETLVSLDGLRDNGNLRYSETESKMRTGTL
jgi:DNA-binding transcriptional ArsR family regulator